MCDVAIPVALSAKKGVAIAVRFKASHAAGTDADIPLRKTGAGYACLFQYPQVKLKKKSFVQSACMTNLLSKTCLKLC